jgi:tRNA A37 methylthiotransferase MiaB
VAYDLEDDVDTAAKKDRNRRLLAQAERTQFLRMQAWVGREVDVFVDSVHDRHPHLVRGRTFHGLPITFEGGPELVGRAARARVGESTPFGLSGVHLAPEQG